MMKRGWRDIIVRLHKIFDTPCLLNMVAHASSFSQSLSPYSSLATTKATKNVTSHALKKERIAVGISGGVDSAVAAMLLKEQGYDVVGIFMRNWDEAEETGNRNCSIEKDLKDAAAVCHQLQIPLHEADFVSQYWNQVFEEFLAHFSRGLTPNPDLACNRYIKFGSLMEFAREKLGIDAIATGHYARLEKLPCDSASGDTVYLLKGVDEKKDQSYFLASVHSETFHHVRFPLGDKKKVDVRKIAVEAGLVPASKRSSAGICFIGRRDFGEFLNQYVSPIPGKYVNVESLDVIASTQSCPDILTVTYGQRPGIGGASGRTYVAGKDINERIVYIASGRDHAALYTRTACLRKPHWLSRKHQEQLFVQGYLKCQFKARYGQPTRHCTLKLVTNESDVQYMFVPSAFCGLLEQDAKVNVGDLVVEFSEPSWSITPQQMFVMYDGDVCIGSAAIGMPGRTIFEENSLSNLH